MTLPRTLSRSEYAPFSRRESRPLAKALALRALAFGSTLLLASPSAPAQPIPLPPLSERAVASGAEVFVRDNIEFSRIRASNVQPFDPAGRGNVLRPIGGGNWDFGIARTELSQLQWVEFLNAFSDVPVPQGRGWSQAVNQLLVGGGAIGRGMGAIGMGSQGRFVWGVTPEGANLPVLGSSWFGAATYCNWLHNGREASIDALLNGAYDLRGIDSTHVGSTVNITRNAGARYWIPTYDEWAVAAFYDPNRNGLGQAGWWPYLDARERSPIPGRPGEGESAAEWAETPNLGEYFSYPVGSYPNSQSPWGLLDTSGSANEVLEGLLYPTDADRTFAGPRSGPFGSAVGVLHIPGWVGAEGALGIGGFTGLRIATYTVPSPAGMMVILAAGWARVSRRSRS